MFVKCQSAKIDEEEKRRKQDVQQRTKGNSPRHYRLRDSDAKLLRATLTRRTGGSGKVSILGRFSSPLPQSDSILQWNESSQRRPEQPSEVWTTISNPTAIQQIKDSAKTLDDSYHDDISKYLQHCTEKRSDVPKNWDVEKMTQEMASIVKTFQNEFPESGSNQ